MTKRDHSAVSLWTKYVLFGWNFALWILCLFFTGIGTYLLVLKDKILGLFFTGIGTYILVPKGKVIKDAAEFFFNSFQQHAAFWSFNTTRLWKTQWKMKKLLVTSNFFISHHVFYMYHNRPKEILGLFFTGIGTYILVLKGKIVKDAIDFFFDPSTVMCTAGSVIVFITFIGWMGALREYTSFLRLYNWIVTLLLLGELVLIVFVFVFYFVPDSKEKLGLFPEKTFQEAITKYGTVDDDDMKNFIDNMQESLQCCGFSNNDQGFLDWNSNEYFNCTNAVKNSERCSVPPSCCKLQPGELKNILCGRRVMQYNNNTKEVSESTNHKPIYRTGCLKAVGDFINDHAIVIGGVLLGILIPQMYFMYQARTLRYQILMQKAKWTR